MNLILGFSFSVFVSFLESLSPILLQTVSHLNLVPRCSFSYVGHSVIAPQHNVPPRALTIPVCSGHLSAGTRLSLHGFPSPSSLGVLQSLSFWFLNPMSSFFSVHSLSVVEHSFQELPKKAGVAAFWNPVWSKILSPLMAGLLGSDIPGWK